MSQEQAAPPKSTDSFAYGPDFLHDYAGQIIDDPDVAILELIANCYDAGSLHVNLRWPALPGEVLSLSDDGIGMTLNELETRWRTWKYNRVESQGSQVIFPKGVTGVTRRAFGHNGKGRFGAFCFGDKYEINTCKDGSFVVAEVSLENGLNTPFRLKVLKQGKRAGHGTAISLVCAKVMMPASHIRDLIGYRFAADPSFLVSVNGQEVQLADIGTRISSRVIQIPDFGEATIHRIDPQKQERTKRLKGIVWWVNRRMVGEPSWEGLDGEGQYLDGRSSEAKRFCFVVEADMLLSDTKADWSGFKQSHACNSVRAEVHRAVQEELQTLLVDDRKAAKRAVIEQNRNLIRQLPAASRLQIGRYLDEAQQKCPNLTERVLAQTVNIWGKLEQSRSGYELLRQLELCSSDDMDTWNRLMQKWTATNAEVVLSELERRLAIIKDLGELIRNRDSDEVHELQPLFERGLWIFGPEYESVEFTSNRGMTHVVQEFFGKKGIAASRRRPDFVVLPDSTIGLYSADEFAGGEVSGVRKILVVELKRGDFRLTVKEMDQARDYARELRLTGCAQANTTIEAFVLGASIETGLEEAKHGERTFIKPTLYDVILKRAQSRIFNLDHKIRQSAPEVPHDIEIEEVLSETSSEVLPFDLGSSVANSYSQSV